MGKEMSYEEATRTRICNTYQTFKLSESETIMDDDTPVYGDYFYICDNTVVRSDIFGTVRDLKRNTKCKEVRRFSFAEKRDCFIGDRVE